MKTAEIDALTRSLAGSFAFCGIAVAQGDLRHFSVGCAPGIVADQDTMFRVASVSKIVTGAMVSAKLMEEDVSPFLNIAQPAPHFVLRHPDWPDVPITGGMLASHSSGLIDDAGYAVPQDMPLQDWLKAQGRAIWSNHKPGTHFCYANLGYVVLGAALETTERFDRMAGRLLQNIGMDGGFNWSGVSSSQRRKGIPTYRWDGAAFAPQIDAEIAQKGVTDPDGKARDLHGYRLGQNASIFAPQGGLRTNLKGMLALAQALKGANHPILWSPEMGTMNDEGGLFDQYSLGVQILREPSFYPRPLVGHFGNAYGFNGGAWYDEKADISFAYALNGLPVGDESDALSDEEKQIFELIARIGKSK